MLTTVGSADEPSVPHREEHSIWKVVAVVAIAGLVAVSGAWVYEATRTGSSTGSHYNTVFSGTLTGNNVSKSSDCAPFSNITCNVTQASVLVPLPGAYPYLMTLLVSLNVTQGPNCTGVAGGPEAGIPCHYILELVSPRDGFYFHQLPPETVNVTLYPPNGTGTWEMPASLGNAWVTVRLVSLIGAGGVASFSTPPFNAVLTVKALTA